MTTPTLPALALEFALPLRAGEARLSVPCDIAPEEWAKLRAWVLVTLAATEVVLKTEKTEKP